MTSPLRILHLEDNQLDVELAGAALEAEGLKCEVTQVDTRDAFLSALESRELDLILSDYALPTYDGMSALAVAREKRPDLPFILLSGTLGEELAIETLKNGGTDYVLKQRLSRLGPAVQRAVRESRERAERRRAEELLSREQQFISAVLDNVQAGIVACDSRGVLSLFNRAAREFHGIPATSVPPSEWEDYYDLFHPDGKTPMSREQVPHFRALKGEIVRDAEMMIIPRQGKPRTLLASGQAIVSATGENLGAVVAMHDITERQHLEEQLRQAQKMEAVGRLAGGIAHDFNNLLTVIMGYNGLLLMRLAEDDPARPNVEEVGRAAQRASSLTRHLLTFSRKQILQPRVLDLNSVVAEVEKMLHRLIGEDVHLKTQLDAEIGNVKADPGHIEQLIMNLAVNARDAMPDGGTLTIRTATISAGRKNAYGSEKSQASVILEVSDTGCGMSDEVQSHIFEPFFTTKEVGRGTGLGLATVYGIVEQWKGQISVASEVGKGTTFRILFPLVEELAQAGRDERTGSSPLGGTETVLLVEDEESIRNLASEVLKMSGYTVLEAANADQALVISDNHKGPIHLMVTDLVMPGISGRALVHCMEPLRSEMRVLFMSGYIGESVQILDPDTPFIQKPFTAVALSQKVREVLNLTARDMDRESESCAV
jgi:two-component system, cell cycle sensor histidine kinase and response regulator CckA